MIIQSNVVSIPDTKHADFVNFVLPIKKLPQKSLWGPFPKHTFLIEHKEKTYHLILNNIGN